MTALDLLSGDAQAFIDKVWASRIHTHHCDELLRFLRLDDVDELLSSSAIRTPAVRVAKDGRVLPSADFTRSATIAGSPLTGLVDARKVFDLFGAGATIILQGLHRYWPPVAGLVRELELQLGHPCQANAYLTPPGSQGFARHRDSHQVFVFQTHGSKTWEVEDDAGERQVHMEPGVCMYLPTGTPHAARTEQSASLHVTVGINEVTYADAVRPLLDTLLTDDGFGDPVPAAYGEDLTGFAAEIRSRLDVLADRLREADPHAAATGQVRRFLTTRPSRLRGALNDLAAPEINDDTRVSRREGSVCHLEEAGDRLRVLLGDRQLLVPARVAAPLEHIRTHPSLRPRDLDQWLDAPGRLVLIRRLVREGLLRVAA